MNFKQFKIIGRLWKAQAYNYVSDPVNIVLGILLTTVTMLCWIAFKPRLDNGLSADGFILASAIGISCIRNSQYNLNCTLSEWRETRFIRNILTTPISRKLLYFAILSFNWIVNIIITLFMFILAMFFDSQRQILYQVEWTPFFIGFCLNILLCNAIALFLSATIRKKDHVLILSSLAYFIPLYLLGLGIPWSTVGQIKIINILTYLAPHRYTLHIMQAAWVGHASDMSFPDVTSGWLFDHGFGYGQNGWWLPMVISLALCCGFLLGFVIFLNKNYKFGLRKYVKYTGINTHIVNIEMIKKSTSVNELKTYLELNQSSKTTIKKRFNKTHYNKKEQGHEET